MFTQMRTLNLRFIGVILFTVLFFVGGFFVNIAKGEAVSTTQSFGVYYSLSPIVSITNSDGSITTKILVGCAPQSGDLYDVNTGRACNNTKMAIIGCKVGSPDIFDVNTGIRCSSYIKPVLVGCGIKSGNVYDINIGKLCTNNTGINIIAKTKKTNTVVKAVEISPIASNLKETLPIENNQDKTSGREKIKDTLAASVVKASSIFNGPMSIWIILIVLIILLGGGYGIYSIMKKGQKISVKKVDTEPIIQQKPITPVTPVITSEPKTINSQLPLNTPNEPNSQVSNL